MSTPQQTDQLATGVQQNHQKNIQHSWISHMQYTMCSILYTMQNMWTTICRKNTEIPQSQISKHIQAIWDRQKRGVLQEHFRHGRCSNTNNIRLQMLHTLTPGNNDLPRQTEETLKQLETLWIIRSEFSQGLNWANYGWSY